MGERARRVPERARASRSRDAARRRRRRRDPALHADDRGARHAGHRRGARRGAREDGVLERLQGARALVGGAAAVLSRRRAAALAALLVALVAYGRRARRAARTSVRARRRVPRRRRASRHVRGCVWLALPLAAAPQPLARARARRSSLLARRLLARRTSTRRRTSRSSLATRSSGSASSRSSRSSGGSCSSRVIIPWVDALSVWRGPTKYVVEEKPEVFERVSSRSRSRARPATAQHRPARHRSSSRSSSPPPTASACAWPDVARDGARVSALTLVLVGVVRHRRPARAARDLPRVPRCRTPTCSGATFAARGPALPSQAEQGDGLDVRRVREHVDRAAALELVAVLVARAPCRSDGERRRVARDVDDPRRLERARPPQRLAREPRARRIDDDDVRAARLARAAPRASGRRCRRRTRRSSIPFSSAFSIAHATDSSEISTPQTVSASAASARPIVPGAAVEVVDGLARPSAPRTRAASS